MRNWKILNRGRVPDPPTTTIELDCSRCGKPARMPVLGIPLAQLAGGGIVFDVGDRAMPELVQCPHCRRRFEAP